MEARALQPLAVVEDNDEDFEALSRVLRETTSREGVRRYASGEEALAGLLEGSDTRPALIILDLNLPGIRGMEVLAALKGDAARADGAGDRALGLLARGGHRRRLRGGRQRVPEQAAGLHGAAPDRAQHARVLADRRSARYAANDRRTGDGARGRRQPREPLRDPSLPLGRAEFDVWEAETGAEGLEMAARDPDLIVLDVHLPDINGFEVCRRLKEDERTRHIPVLQRSQSHVDDAARVHGLESGADAYLTEPVDPSVLVATARALLRVRRAENRLRLLNQVGVAARDRAHPRRRAAVRLRRRERRDRPRPDVLPVRREPPLAARDPGEDVAAELTFDADDPVAEVARTAEPRFDERQGIAPLVAYGHRLGALTVPVTLSETERELLLALSTQCAQALERAGLYEHQHHIATTLQEGLLPKSLPEIDGAEVAARYNAGARAMEVGGDFYDVFPRGGGLGDGDRRRLRPRCRGCGADRPRPPHDPRAGRSTSSTRARSCGRSTTRSWPRSAATPRASSPRVASWSAATVPCARRSPAIRRV